MKSGTKLFRKSVCSRCHVAHFKKGFRQLNGNIQYYDKKRRRWQDRICPDCRVEAGYKRVKTIEPDLHDLGPAEVLYPPKLRKCRKCGDATVNYFSCKPCITSAERHSREQGVDVGCEADNLLGSTVSDFVDFATTRFM